MNEHSIKAADEKAAVIQALAEAFYHGGPDSPKVEELAQKLQALAAKEDKEDQEREASRRERRKKNHDKFIAEALAIESEAAKEAGAIGFMARALTQATMPHKRTDAIQFTRRNGSFELSITALGKHGLPYGAIPRLLTSWVTTEAVRTKERQLVLGHSLSAFMRELDMVPTGGRWGSITRLRDQMRRLFSSAVYAGYSDAHRDEGITIPIADKFKLWWDPKEPEQAALWESTLLLSKPFFDEVTQSPVPVDMRALKALKGSPMALDIYVWMTYRMSYLRKPTLIPWEALQMQFGADYARTRAFKEAFLKHLRSVSVLYTEARIQPLSHGLELRPSRPHIPFKPKTGG